MKTLKQLKAELESVRKQACEIKDQIRNTSDGFKYLTETCVYGSVTWKSHNNSFAADEEISQYWNDYSTVYLYTNNPNHGLANYSGITEIISEEDMINMSKENIK
jgi:uncharacterized protein YbcV (DUF1398 family)